MNHSTTLPLDCPDLPLLASIGEATYHELALVVRRESGRSSLYCLRRDWESLPAGQLAARDSTIAALHLIVQELGVRVAELETTADLTQRREDAKGKEDQNLSAFAPLRQDKPPLRLSPLAHAEASAAPLVCPICGKNGFLSARALIIHRGRVHPEMPPDTPPADRVECPDCGEYMKPRGLGAHRRRAHGVHGKHREILPVTATDAPFRCAACGRDEFAASVADPRCCMRCAAKGNGYLVEA